jgi:hypothetical protein
MRNRNKRRWLGIVQLGFCTMLVVMFNLIAQPPTKAAETGRQVQQATATPVTTTGSNIRSGPGTEYTILRTVKANTPLDIVGYNDDKEKTAVWYTLRDGGWISGSLVKNPPSDVEYVAAPGAGGGTPTNTSSTNTNPQATPTPTATTAAPPPPTNTATPNNCHSSYTPCVPIASDVDCAGGSGNGPAYVRGPVSVIGPDVYGLDRDGDSVGCE